MSIVAIILSLVLFTIFPGLLGNTIVGITKVKTRAWSRYILGFFGMVAMAYVIYLPFGFTGRSFHRYAQVYGIVATTLCLLGLLFFGKELMKVIRSQTMAFFAFIKRHPMALVVILMILLQCIRAFHYTQLHYSDDDTYIPLVNDIIQSDQFFRVNWANGEMLSGAYALDAKYRYTGWFPFQALLCYYTGLHPLIMVKSIFPMALILLHYAVIWNLMEVWNERFDGESRCVYLFFYGLLLEFGWGTITTSWSYYFLTWIWYGKSFLHLMVIPFLLAHLLQFRGKKLGDWCVLLLVIVAGCGASTMGLLLIPAELGLFVLTACIEYLVKTRRARA